MTGEQFRQLMADADLTVRATADLLSRGAPDDRRVSPATIMRWRHWEGERSPIPYWAVERIRQHIAAEREGVSGEGVNRGTVAPPGGTSLRAGRHRGDGRGGGPDLPGPPPTTNHTTDEQGQQGDEQP